MKRESAGIISVNPNSYGPSCDDTTGAEFVTFVASVCCDVAR